ncbi:microtubule-actin cross-linking factor 1, isoforms 6/7-like [Cloeon dipterum]|uniref:microtubule-actin cross-linking factor 1, isoforms 6/7-like n=1 Tax=Cloeon dipterum TaxID=197152 RepID=UPI00321F64BF
MEALLPSEIARLVWGYLQKECPKAAHVFLESCPSLAEFRDARLKGRRVLNTVNGHTLLDLLADLSDTFCYVTETQDALLQDEARLVVKNKFSLCSKVEYLINYVKAEKANETALNDTRDADVARESDYREESPDEMEGIDEDILITSPVRALIANLANKLKNSKPNIPFKKRIVTGGPSMNLEATSDDSAMAAPKEMDPILQPFLKSTQLHEKIAESINKILQPKATCDDRINKDLEEAIHQVVQETEKDPTFEDIIQEICLVSSQAALSDGGSEDNALNLPFSPTTSLNLDTISEISQPSELHTPDPEETEMQNTPNKGKKSKQKGAPSTPNNPASEVPLKARLRSASKIGHREEDLSQDSLQQLNDEVVRSIVETICEDVNHLSVPAIEEPSIICDNNAPCQLVTEKSQDAAAAPEISQEVPTVVEEQQTTSIFDQSVASVSMEHQDNQTVRIHKPPTPVLPPVIVHPNPSMPANPISSIILVLDHNQAAADPTKGVFSKRLLPIAPKIGSRVAPSRYSAKRIKTTKPDRNLKAKPLQVSKKPQSSNSIIVLDGVVPAAPTTESFTLNYPNVSATVDILEPASPEIIMPTPEHSMPLIPLASPQVVPVPQIAIISMPSLSPAVVPGPNPIEVSTAPAAPTARASSPIAVAPSENSAERPIEVRKTQSTPRRNSSYVRALDFSTPDKSQTTPRRAYTSPKTIKPPGPATVKKLKLAASFVRSELFYESPEKAREKRLSLISEEPSKQPERPLLPEPVIQSAAQMEKTPDTSLESSTTAESPVTTEKDISAAKPSKKQSASWDADLRAKVGPVLISPVKRSPAKRHRVGGHPPSAKKRKKSTSTNKKQEEEEKLANEINPEKPKESSSKQKPLTKRSRTVLKTLNAPSTNTRAAGEKERLLESLQLSPSKPPERLPEPTFSLNDPRMSLKICPIQSILPGNFVPDVDRSYCMTISVECDDGAEADISLTWSTPDVWDSHTGTTEKFKGDMLEAEEPSKAVLGAVAEDDDLMTLSLVASSRAKEPCAPLSGLPPPRSKTRSSNESSNPQDMLRKVGVDKLLSALHGTKKK